MELWEHNEAWAEREAQFCDQMVADMKKHSDDWSAKSGHHTSMQMAYECSIRADVWRQMADSLRRPKRIRLERESYEQ